MKKFKPKKNFLREFIFNNNMKQASEQTVKSLLRSIVEPVIQSNSDGVVLIRLFDTKGLGGLLKRLDFSRVGVYFYSDMGENIVNVAQEDIWDTTEFAVVLAPRYCAALIWDYGVSEVKGYSNISFYLNTRRIQEILKEVIDNSRIDFMPDVEPYSLERRENELMCDAVNRVVDCLNEAVIEEHITSEAVIDKQDKPIVSSEVKKLIHEIRNNLSVIDLHSKIIEKRAAKTDSDTAEKILNAKAIIEKSTQTINVLLQNWKESCEVNLEELEVRDLIEMALELAEPKLKEKNILVETKLAKVNVLADETRVLGVLMNVINNAVYALKDNGELSINIDKNSDGTVGILIENNGLPIEKNIQSEIFEEGFTTKSKHGGSGLGLEISKKAMLAMGGDLNLVKSDEISTVFEITLKCKTN